MSVVVESPTFLSLQQLRDATPEGEKYWWLTSGRDLARMLQEANYPVETQRQFLLYFRDTICPRLGGRPQSSSVRSGVGWDGNPFEYSFELRNTSKKIAVRFVVDVSALRPADDAHPLSIENFEAVLDPLSKATPGYDEAWYTSLKKWFVHAHLPSSEQKGLISKVGYQMPMILGFDVCRDLPTKDAIPVMAKVYFPPCFTAAREGITRWEAVRRGIHQLPNIEAHPNYLNTKPKEYENGPRYLATDFVIKDKARLKIYFRHPAVDFEDIWDYYTLGGRISGLDNDKETFRELMAFTSYNPDSSTTQDSGRADYTAVQRKMTAIYFSLSTENPTPAPKICFYPANFALNDSVIGEGIDVWLNKYEWKDEGESMKEKVEKVL
ncbi:hypothetical protein HBH47_012850 [Parastagonospora nodorum]|nr:hypothetical protein HBH47_012850 [Parastagonospora nodorum]